MTDKQKALEALEALDKYFEVASGHSCGQCCAPSDVDLLDAIRATVDIRAALTEKETEWLPIESAPKPSGQILLLSEGAVYNGHWYSTYQKWEYDCHFHPKTQPTHWMPLPQPPKGTNDE